jgi:hypothetical protein
VFTGLTIGETSWFEWHIELLLLAEFAARKDGVDAAISLFDSIEQQAGGHFDGSMSSWREISDASPTSLVIVRSENPAFFFGLNNALLTLFNLTVPLPDGSTPDCTQADMDRLGLLIFYANNGRSPLSTRMKALHLLLSAKARGDPAEIAEAERDARAVFATKAAAELTGSVRARWLATRAMSHGVNPDYVAAFTEIRLEMPCGEDVYTPPKRRPWPMKGLTEIAERAREAFRQLLADPQPTIPVDQGDVIVGNLVRISDLFERVLSASADDDGLAAEIFQRSLTDSVIQLRWLLLRNDDANFTKFKEHSLAQERDAFERVVGELEKTDMSKEEAWSLIRRDYAALTERLGKWPELLDVIYGPWSEQSTSSMAREIDPFLEKVFQRSSDATHGTWRSIEKYHLSRCLNPLHPAHHVTPSGPRRSAGIVPCITALMQCIDLLLSIYMYVEEKGAAVTEMENARADLLTWISTHQKSFGIFDWESVEELTVTTPNEASRNTN